MTNAAMSASLFVSYYPQKSSVADLKGFGISTGVAYTWGIYAGVGAGAEIMSNGKIGLSGNVGAGYGIAPAHWAVNAGWTTQIAKEKYSSSNKAEKSYDKKGVQYSIKTKNGVTTICIKNKRVKTTVDKTKRVKVRKY